MESDGGEAGGGIDYELALHGALQKERIERLPKVIFSIHRCSIKNFNVYIQRENLCRGQYAQNICLEDGFYLLQGPVPLLYLQMWEEAAYF